MGPLGARAMWGLCEGSHWGCPRWGHFTGLSPHRVLLMGLTSLKPCNGPSLGTPLMALPSAEPCHRSPSGLPSEATSQVSPDRCPVVVPLMPSPVQHCGTPEQESPPGIQAGPGWPRYAPGDSSWNWAFPHCGGDP